MNVVILHEQLGADARADERDVLDQVAAVAGALDELGHRQVTIPFAGGTEALIGRLRALRAEVVFNLVESVDGSGRAVDRVPAALAAAGLPFTGSDAAAMALAASKLDTKVRLAELGLPTPHWRTVDELRRGAALTAARYVVKSVWEHGSLGLEADSVVAASAPAGLAAAIEQRLPMLGGSAFAEEYVHGREFNLAMLAGEDGVENLPPAEIRFEGAEEAVRIVGYRAKWSPGSPEDEGTPRSFAVTEHDLDLVDRMRALTRAVWEGFGLSGYARVDLRVDDAGAPWIIDVNTNPCLSPDAGFAAAVAQAGLAFPLAVERILAAALVAAQH